MLRIMYLFLAVFNFSLTAMIPPIGYDEWVEIMSNKDGVIIESDLDCAQTLPNIAESYLQVNPEQRPASDNSPRVRKHEILVDYSILIIDLYPQGMEEQLKNVQVIYRLKRSGAFLRKK